MRRFIDRMVFLFGMVIYNIGIYLCLPFIVLNLFWRSYRLPAYRQRVLERLGIFDTPMRTNGLWLHAVSVGEVVAASPILSLLLAGGMGLPITVTTTTPTGSGRLMQLLGTKVQHVYVPYDVPFAIRGFLRRVQPRMLIVMETEIWPNLLRICAQQNIPVILANARLSDRSFRGYKLLRPFMHSILQKFAVIAAQSSLDRERFITLGANPATTIPLGNLKFDVSVAPEQLQIGAVLKASIGRRKIWVAASTHAGEEELILQAYVSVKQILGDLLLILIPRHPNRFAQVADLLEQTGLNFVKRSDDQPCTPEVDIILGDTMGELTVFYAAADVVFVGGSLVPVGGHNLLEPAVVAVPIITGPYTENFRAITAELLKNHGLLVINNTQELVVQLLFVLQNSIQARELATNAQTVVLNNQGVASKIVGIIFAHLSN